MRPKLEVTELTREFFDFLLDGPLGAMRLPGPLDAPGRSASRSSPA